MSSNTSGFEASISINWYLLPLKTIEFGTNPAAFVFPDVVATGAVAVVVVTVVVVAVVIAAVVVVAVAVVAVAVDTSALSVFCHL